MASQALQVINVALGEVGYREGSNNYQKYSPAVPGLEWSQNQPWCQTFQSWCFQQAGLKSLAPVTASCAAAVQWYMDRGRWSWYPAVGGMVLYGPGGGSHVGLVYAFDATYIYTIEGNTDGSGGAEGDGVYTRQRVRRDDYVYGYGYPAYSEGILSADPTKGGLTQAHMNDLNTTPTPDPEPDPEPDPGTPARTVHKVVEGNTLSGLATTYNTTVDNIVAWNGLLQVGMNLWVSPPNTSPPVTGAVPINVQDNFENSSASSSAWPHDTSVTFSNGVANLPINSSYNGYMEHKDRWNMTGKSVYAKVSMPSVGNGSKEFFFTLEADTNNSISFIISGSTLYMRRRQGGTNSNTTLTYSSTSHKYLRIRNYNNTLYWDTSADGVTWTERRNATYTLNITNMRLQFFAGYWNSESASTVTVDNVNNTGTITTPPPPPPPTTPGTTVYVDNVQPGKTNADVEIVQRALIAEGFSIPSGPTGTFGTETQAAYKAFELSLGYTEPGAPPPPPPSTTVKLSDVQYGDENASVAIVQNALIAEGFSIAAGATGYFGDQTKAAYSAFQQSLGYSGSAADGNPGCTSLTTLGSRRGFTANCDVPDSPPTGDANSPTTGSISTSSVLFSKNTGIASNFSTAQGYAYQAAAKCGVPSTWVTGMSNGANLMTLIVRESSYNPNVVNTYDSNAWGAIQSDGAPYNCSRGYCQTIPPTFANWHEEGTSNRIYEPVSNICAAINYIRQQYGGIQNVQQANPNMSPRGY